MLHQRFSYLFLLGWFSLPSSFSASALLSRLYIEKKKYPSALHPTSDLYCAVYVAVSCASACVCVCTMNKCMKHDAKVNTTYSCPRFPHRQFLLFLLQIEYVIIAYTAYPYPYPSHRCIPRLIFNDPMDRGVFMVNEPRAQHKDELAYVVRSAHRIIFSFQKFVEFYCVTCYYIRCKVFVCL